MSSDPAGVLRWGSLAVVWRFDGDRFSHRISAVAAASLDAASSEAATGEPPSLEYETVLWESREGTAADRWPASPPFQQLSVEPAPDGAPRAFLVGQSGVSHWSAAVEGVFFDSVARAVRRPNEMSNPAAAAEAILPSEAGGPATWRPAILFDAACRVKEPPQLLGSAYRAAKPAVPGTSDAQAAEFRSRLRFEPWPLPEEEALLAADAGAAAVSLQRLAPATLRTPATLRWRYLWMWE